MSASTLWAHVTSAGIVNTGTDLVYTNVQDQHGRIALVSKDEDDLERLRTAVKEQALKVVVITAT